ncbi:hypothetical protein Goshw_016979 [Gossypium schwendimanii]|uniref:Uncharacterized protein n=1 Tax=Gossypium schwendimanii TaxID=34291 RepID=A0A7J9LHD3_GOSSC|nr:hypothetical protein [Gossypium schwendimanii]
MEKYFGNAYRGDPGVPHAGPDRFVNIWIGSAAFSVLTWFNPYMWQLTNQFKWQILHYANLAFIYTFLFVLDIACSRVSFYLLIWSMSICSWHDKAMIFEHYHWKKAKAKNQPYKFKRSHKPFSFVLFSGMSTWTRITGTRIISTGLSTSHSVSFM